MVRLGNIKSLKKPFFPFVAPPLPPPKTKTKTKVLKSNLTPQSKIWVLVTKPSLLTRPKKNSWWLGVGGVGVGWGEVSPQVM
jgi:hypothetical protein